jgi:hypothetical protein
VSDRPRRWDDCNADPCTCPKPITLSFGNVAGMAIKQERARWVEWLAVIGYGIDFTHHPHPPCTPRDVAAVYADREPIPACDLRDDEDSTDVHEWVIAQNTGWREAR